MIGSPPGYARPVRRFDIPGDTNYTTSHDEIKHWASEREASPASVRGTADNDDIGVLRLDFPGYSGEESLEHISWDDFFAKFEEKDLAMIYQDQTADGETSRFFKFVRRGENTD